MLKKNRLTLGLFASLVVLASLSAAVTFATAQRTQISQPRLSAAELDKAAESPSIEATILRLAAEKVRTDGRPGATVELPLTIKVSAVPPPGCFQTCVWQGPKVIACTVRICHDPR